MKNPNFHRGRVFVVRLLLYALLLLTTWLVLKGFFSFH